MLKERTEKILGAIISCLAIGVSVIGLFYSDGGASFQVNNIYGQPVVLYGKGIYANNSLMTVAGRLGADWMGLISGLIPFKDHINIEAEGLARHINDFNGCKFTPKGMLQIKTNQVIDFERLKKVFSETLV